MKSLHCRIATVCCFVLATAPAAPAHADAPADGKLTPAQLVEDFRLLRKALEEAHSGIYRYTPKVELDHIFDRAEKSLDRPMDVYEFYRVVAPVVAAVKCGHTGVLLPPGRSSEPILPLGVRLINGKVYVFRDLSPERGRLAGMEIVSINRVPAADIVKTLVAATTADGDVQPARFHRLRDLRFARALRGLADIKEPFDVALHDSARNEDITVHLQGVNRGELTTAWRGKFPQDQPPLESASLRFEDGGAIAILKINRFGGMAGPDRKQRLGDFINEAFAEIDAKKSTSLILDLRNNGGGADELGKLLLSHLVDKPFRYYDDLVVNALEFSFGKYIVPPSKIPAAPYERRPDGKYRMTKHPNWGEQQPRKPTFHGKVYALINGGSFSTTCEFLSHLHSQKRATFIGEEAAGGYYGNTSGRYLRVTLPHTKLMLGVPVMTYYLSVEANHDAAHSVVPDQPVSYTIDELLAGKDKELEAALQLARGK